MVRNIENFFAFPTLWWYKRLHFHIAYLPFSFEVSECVISHDEHEYYGDTMRQ